ncbi:hypothetical protein JCM10207_001187 [Rhodosporidiobolus poonsookiae]
MEDDRPTAAKVDLEEDAEDAVPDWSKFADFKRANKDADASPAFTTGGRSTLVPFIPKRGEKDFEPLAPDSSFPSGSTEATLSAHQQRLLQASRHALYSALSSGNRQHGSRAHNSFTWRPDLARASCDSEDGLAAHGIHFGNIGHFHVERKRLELLPEEALYMCERGGIELWREYDGEDAAEKRRVPMSVQQTWAECLGQDDLTPEKYQVYAFLRRLGYVVVRARPVPGTSRPIYTPPPPPFYLRFLALLARPFLALRDGLVRAARDMQLALRVAGAVLNRQQGEGRKRVRWSTTRVLGKDQGRYRSLASGGRWTSYDQIFSRLQIIPATGLHSSSSPLRAPLPHAPSPLSPVASSTTTSADAGLPSFDEYPYQPFWHVYKPVTKYKKNNPPEPDFRLVVVNAATTPLPTLYELSSLFSTLPLADDYDPLADPLAPRPSTSAPGPSAGPAAVAAAARKPAPASKPSPSPAAAEASTHAPSRLSALAASVVPSCLARLLPSSLAPSPAATPSGPKPRAPRPPTPYPFLKTGRRSVLLAIVDNGTSSILRLSEAEFAKVAWVGGRRA